MQAVAHHTSGRQRAVIPIVPYSVKGRYRTLKTVILIVAYTVYFLLPWLSWKSAGRVVQPVLFDLAHSRFYFFNLVVFPQDLIIVAGFMVLAAALLFLSAAVYGRVFCGFFCFQTLWTDAFRWIERAVQGEAQARIRLRKQPWSIAKASKLALTHTLWLCLAFATALTFTLYFADAPRLFHAIFHGQAAPAAYVTIVVLTATTYVAAGLAREQICLVACPYGKFQSVMQDASTTTVTYDAARGERSLGRAAPGVIPVSGSARQSQGYGDCVDCAYCAKVCPTGVDIRKGFQIDCIACGLCVDACDSIMESVKLPKGLIRFDRSSAPDTATAWGRWKKSGYLAAVAGAAGFIIYATSTIEPFQAVVQKSEQAREVQLANGDIKMRYTLKITNKTPYRETYLVTAQGLPADASILNQQFEVPSGKTYSNVFSIVLKNSPAERHRDFVVLVVPRGNPANRKALHLNAL